MSGWIGPNTHVVLHDHREGKDCNERCYEVPRLAPAPPEPEQTGENGNG